MSKKFIKEVLGLTPISTPKTSLDVLKINRRSFLLLLLALAACKGKTGDDVREINTQTQTKTIDTNASANLKHEPGDQNEITVRPTGVIGTTVTVFD